MLRASISSLPRGMLRCCSDVAVQRVAGKISVEDQTINQWPCTYRERWYPGRLISGAMLLCVGAAAPTSAPVVLAISDPQTPAALRSLEGRVSGRCNALDMSARRLPGAEAKSKKECVGESCEWRSGVPWPEFVLDVDEIDAESES